MPPHSGNENASEAVGIRSIPAVFAAPSQRLLPWLIAVAFFIESLDTTILNTGVPTIAAALHVAPLSMKSVLSSYTLSLAVFVPISGWMADRFGTRRVFASAIGLFTLGSFLCRISTHIHELVAFRILQGCGGAMMVPVGRLTMVRTFAKSQLIRAMSFVAIPGLIGPMLGPIAGGLIVAYFHWRMIFFVNIPIGLTGLYLVYRNLRDYREEHVDPLDIVGLILFGSGVALCSYVLEVFGEHTLGPTEILGLLALAVALLAGYGLHATRIAHPMLNLRLFRIRTFCSAVSGSFITRLGIGGIPFFVSAAVPSGIGVLADRIGVVDDAASDSGDEFEDDHAANPGTVRISNGIGLEHHFHRVADSAVFDHRTWHAGVADRDDGVLLRLFHFVAVHEHEYAGVCGRYRRASKRREFDCQHPAADVDQFRCGHGVAGHGGVSAGPLSGQSDAIHPRNSPGIWGVGCYDGAVDAGISRVAARRRRGGKPGAATASLI